MKDDQAVLTLIRLRTKTPTLAFTDRHEVTPDD